MKPKNSDLAEVIGERIKHFRLQRGWSQQQLGERCRWPADTAQGRVSHYEKGRRSPDLGDIVILSQVFGVSLEQLLFGQAQKIQVVMREVPLVRWADIVSPRARKKAPLLYWPAVAKAGGEAFVVKIPENAGEFQRDDLALIDPAATPRANDYVLAGLAGGRIRLCQYVAHGARRFSLKQLDCKTSLVPYNKSVTPIYGVVISLLRAYR